MDSKYSHTTTEDSLYTLWENAGVFNPDTNTAGLSDKSLPFSIIMPPPNANDPLHVGHALFVSLEDMMIRYNRMIGNDTVWIPGTDHAGIETQFVFERKLKKEGKSRFNFDRSTLFKMIWEYVQENSTVAVDQIKQLGASADWSRFAFTLTPKITADVTQTFTNLYKDGLIYRNLQLINFCTQCGTGYSELEVNHSEQINPLYTIQYGPLSVSTVRPETIFGDVAVAVNPKDTRYTEYVGTTISVDFPWGKKELPVIADEYVDPEFGTGVVKITPYHDPNDFAVWQKHRLEITEEPQAIITTSGKIAINELVPLEFQGLATSVARQKVVDAYTTYQDGKLLLSVNKNYKNNIGSCYRCGRTIEPLPLPQFFLKVTDPKLNLVERALRALDSKETVVLGAGREKILRHWLTNLKDWNISRQIVWGISIPAWYLVTGNEDKIRVNFINTTGKYTSGLLSELLLEYSFDEIKQNIQQITADISIEPIISVTKPSNSDAEYLQETDTFDTWFSSSQWPVITLKNARPNDFKRFYPTSVMETGYDILPFWVMRMMLLCTYITRDSEHPEGISPFKTVYLHGLARDQKGQKMSKSKGNVINPLSIKTEFGADALRLALVIRSTPGMDKSVGIPDFKAARNFTNKLWNAARFVILQLENEVELEQINKYPQEDAFNQKLSEIVSQITSEYSEYKLGIATENLYAYFWHWYCDQCIEDHKKGDISQAALLNGLIIFLKLLHPITPFITEAIWQELRSQEKLAKHPDLKNTPLLIAASWPKP